ncbi:lysylphosphatidylglycerol synthase transmembrane domain-containing protein [Marinobacter sp. VGCF2001]|uniref:lysylphosphatidylglycerol synthase transmembrane domain-containing protein n=1 Tax=Marinobacter sp. VGCF2001 TaxID=3417189 RepID=UPI003CF5398D
MADAQLNASELSKRVGKAVFRWGVTLSLLGIVLAFVDVGALLERLAMVPWFVALAVFAVSLIQVALSAWRWRYTAGRLGVAMGFGFAFREYYLAVFFNQVLPGGVMGDVNRAWRHTRAARRLQQLAIVHAVVLERLSGQLVLVPVAVFALLGLWWSGQFDSQWGDTGVSLNLGYWVFVPVLLGFATLLAFVTGVGTRLKRYIRRLGGDVGRAFLGWRNAFLQFGTSVLVLLTYLVVFALMAAGMGLFADGMPWLVFVALCPLLLLSMVVPVTVSGWGVREGVAAILWPLLGLPAEQGVALSVGYGTAVFFAALPGAMGLMARR